jgi:hypothetical protein
MIRSPGTTAQMSSDRGSLVGRALHGGDRGDALSLDSKPVASGLERNAFGVESDYFGSECLVVLLGDGDISADESLPTNGAGSYGLGVAAVDGPVEAESEDSADASGNAGQPDLLLVLRVQLPALCVGVLVVRDGNHAASETGGNSDGKSLTDDRTHG